MKTEQELENSIGMQIGFLLYSDKSAGNVVEDLKQIAIDYADQFKVKSEKWDKLSDKIEKCYVDEEGEELSDEESEGIDLGTIGEIAATAFGWI